jgi:hypothetical protein
MPMIKTALDAVMIAFLAISRNQRLRVDFEAAKQTFVLPPIVGEALQKPES